MTRRIVHVVQHLRPGGIEAVALDMLRHAPAGYEVHVVSLEGCKPVATAHWPALRENIARLHFLDKKPGLRPGTITALWRLLRTLGADAVHTHHIGPLVYGGIAARMAGIGRVLHTEHDAWHLSSPRRRRVQGLALGLVRPTVVADADVVAAILRAHWPSLAPTVIVNGIDAERFNLGSRVLARRNFGLPTDIRIVGCAARLEIVKGHDVLINAVASLPNHVHLALAGGGSQEKQLRAMVAKLRIGGRVHFLGQVDNMPTFYQALDVFCLASRSEGLPLSILEAQACGVPVVVTDVGGCRQAVCPRTGTVVPSGNHALLAQALSGRIVTPLAVSPRDFVKDHRDIRQMAESYTKLIFPPVGSRMTNAA